MTCPKHRLGTLDSWTSHLLLVQRRDGLVVGVDHDHVVLKNITQDLGKPVADLIIEKKREVEKYCPSGCYPTEVRTGRSHN